MEETKVSSTPQRKQSLEKSSKQVKFLHNVRRQRQMNISTRGLEIYSGNTQDKKIAEHKTEAVLINSKNKKELTLTLTEEDNIYARYKVLMGVGSSPLKTIRRVEATRHND